MNPHAPERTVRAVYWFGDVVFLRVAEERSKGMIVGANFRPGGGLTYLVQWDGAETYHYEIELTREYLPDFGSDADVVDD